jgi:hypothetical protein
MTASEMPPPVPPVDTEDLSEQEHRALVRLYEQRMRAEDEARRKVRQERAGALVEPALVPLGDFLAVEDDAVRYRVDGLWPVDGRVVLAAQYKAGKSHTLANLLRSLADGSPFLEHFDVTPPARRIALIDNELPESMLRRWLRDQGVQQVERVEVLSLKGRVGTFDLLDPDTRARWADKLREAQVDVVLFDCLRPVLDALGLSEDKEAGRFLVQFDALLAEAGVAEAVLVHHMGHTGERSRGDTRLRDWPDVEWTLVREKTEDGDSDPSGARFFKAYGRDVDQPEGLLEYDHETRRVTWAGGNRREAAADKHLPEVLDYLRANPGASQRAVETALAHLKRADVRAALRRSIQLGQVSTQEGPRRAILHFLDTPECASAPSAPEVRQRTSDECASAPIGGALHSLAEEPERPTAHSTPGAVGPCQGQCGRSIVLYGDDCASRLCPRCAAKTVGAA